MEKADPRIEQGLLCLFYFLFFFHINWMESPYEQDTCEKKNELKTGLSRHQYSERSILSNRLIKVFKVSNIQSGRNARDKDTASPPELAIVRRIKD